MRIPRAQRPAVPAVDPGFPGISIQGAGGLGRSVAGIGETIGVAAGQLAKVERAIIETRQSVILAKSMNDLENHMTEMIESAGPNETPSAFTQRFQDSSEQYLQKAAEPFQDERAKNAILSHGMNRITTRSAAAHARALQVNAIAAQDEALTQLDVLERQGTMEAVKTGEGIIASLVESKYWTPEQAEAKRSALRKGSVSNAFGRLIEADPQRAFDMVNRRADVFSLVDDADWSRLVASARNEIDRGEQKARAEVRWRWAQADQRNEEWERERKDLVRMIKGDIYADILAKKDISAKLVEHVRILGDDVATIQARADAFRARGDEQDDPETKVRVLRMAAADEPTITAEEITTMGGLSAQSKQTLAFHVQSVRRSLKAQERTLWHTEYQQARDHLTTNFTRAAATTKYRGAEIAQMEIAALSEFLERTVRKAGEPEGTPKESPFAVSREITDRYLPALQRTSRMEAEDVKLGLPERYRSVDPDMAKRLLRIDLGSGAVSEEDANKWAGILRQLEEIRRQQEEAEPRTSGQPGQPTAKKPRP